MFVVHAAEFASCRCLAALQFGCCHCNCRCYHDAQQHLASSCQGVERRLHLALVCCVRFLTELNPITAAALTVFQASGSGSGQVFRSSCSRASEKELTFERRAEAMSWVVASRKGVAAKFESRASLQAPGGQDGTGWNRGKEAVAL